MQLERAVTLFATGEPRAPALASARFALAQALWSSGADRGRARQLAEQALAVHRSTGIEKTAAEISRWLARPR